MTSPSDPHGNQLVLRHGPAARQARLAMILVHGRGASAEDILGLAFELRLDDILYVAPQAEGHTWYPYSFLTPTERNEPGLTSGLNGISSLIDTLRHEGVAPERVGLLGFSQGACLALEYAARYARRYATVVGLSGGLIGPPGTHRDYPGTLDGTPVFLGCSDIDSHIPVERVHETAEVFTRLGAIVDTRIYPGMGHIVNEDEIAAVRALLSGPASGARP
ncbi:MAG TPA: dienelactone hydrolase family protein [Vicinamibacterales bacterium]|nr:dienelactone hydrolase family protein [Vicinamibacterales bacterium]